MGSNLRQTGSCRFGLGYFCEWMGVEQLIGIRPHQVQQLQASLFPLGLVLWTSTEGECLSLVRQSADDRPKAPEQRHHSVRLASASTGSVGSAMAAC